MQKIVKNNQFRCKLQNSSLGHDVRRVSANEAEISLNNQNYTDTKHDHTPSLPSLRMTNPLPLFLLDTTNLDPSGFVARVNLA